MSNVIIRKTRTVLSVLRRVRSDGRMPTESKRLAIDALRVSLADVFAAPVSCVLPVVGRGLGPVGVVRRWGWRRWSAAGELSGSVHDLAVAQATTVVDALVAKGIRPFVTSAAGTGLEIGVRADDAGRAWEALRDLTPRGTWYVEWSRGRRSRAVSTASRTWVGPVRRAESWRVFQLRHDADGVLVGADQGPLVVFWAQGPHERLERVGVRGLNRFPASSPETVETIDGHDFPSRASFAPARSIARHQEPIDLVITWVDGDDPDWKSRRAQASGQTVHSTRDADDDARFRSRDELRYLLRSVARNAGWFRRVHVVTADQRPAWLVEDERLRVVTHHEIFPTNWLPTFNSHSIESRLHRIPGLANHFVYANDDMFFGRPLTPGAFFTPNGLALFAVGEGRVDPGDTSDLGVDVAARNGRRLIEQHFARTVEHKLLHAPYALRRDVIEDIEALFADEMARTGASQFRSSTDLSVASSFAQYVAFCTGRALPGSLTVKYVNIENANLAQHLRQIRTRRFDCFCLNATEQTARRDVDAQVVDFLEAYFPIPSPWEAPDA